MQAAGKGEGLVIKFSTSVEHRHDDFQCRFAALVFVYWDTAAVIKDAAAAINMQQHIDFIAMSTHSLID